MQLTVLETMTADVPVAIATQDSTPARSQATLDIVVKAESTIEQSKGTTDTDAHKASREQAIEAANRALAIRSEPSQGVQNALGMAVEAGSAAEQVKETVTTWNPLLRRVEKFVELTDAMASVRALVGARQSALTDTA